MSWEVIETNEERARESEGVREGGWVREGGGGERENCNVNRR